MSTARSGRRVSVQHLDVFAAAPGGGNPCPVVADATGLSAGDMQSIAAHYGHESGFVLRDDDGGLRLRFFVPRHEMAMCVHATVAAMTVLAADGDLPDGEFVVRTASGDCRVIVSDEVPPVMTVEQQPPQLGAPLDRADDVAAALGLDATAMDERRPIRSVSVSRAKLIIPLRHAADVHAVEPILDQLWRICRDESVTGMYVFAPHPDGRPDHVVARQFPVDAGYPEDPATGVAAGALAVYLADQDRPALPSWRRIDIDQGEAMGRPSRMQASAFVDGDGVHRSTVSGRATHRGSADLDLDTVLADEITEPADAAPELR